MVADARAEKEENDEEEKDEEEKEDAWEMGDAQVVDEDRCKDCPTESNEGISFIKVIRKSLKQKSSDRKKTLEPSFIKHGPVDDVVEEVDLTENTVNIDSLEDTLGSGSIKRLCIYLQSKLSYFKN